MKQRSPDKTAWILLWAEQAARKVLPKEVIFELISIHIFLGSDSNEMIRLISLFLHSYRYSESKGNKFFQKRTILFSALGHSFKIILISMKLPSIVYSLCKIYLEMNTNLQFFIPSSTYVIWSSDLLKIPQI